MYLQKKISIKTWRKNLFFVDILKVTDKKEPDPEPDPLVKGADPTIRIRTKMSQIWKTAKYPGLRKLQWLLIF